MFDGETVFRPRVKDLGLGSQSSTIFLASNVDDHVGLGRHVTVDALRAGAAGRVMMVLRHVEFDAHVTLGAGVICSDCHDPHSAKLRADDGPGRLHGDGGCMRAGREPARKRLAGEALESYLTSRCRSAP